MRKIDDLTTATGNWISVRVSVRTAIENSIWSTVEIFVRRAVISPVENSLWDAVGFAVRNVVRRSLR